MQATKKQTCTLMLGIHSLERCDATIKHRAMDKRRNFYRCLDELERL